MQRTTDVEDVYRTGLSGKDSARICLCASRFLFSSLGARLPTTTAPRVTMTETRE